MRPLWQGVRRLSEVAGVGKQLKTKEQLLKYMNTPTWNTKGLLQDQGTENKFDKSILDGLLDLSGLEKDLSEAEREKLWSSLKDQLRLLNHLHSIELDKDEVLKLTRLVDDASNEGTLDFDGLMSEIEKAKPDFSKGEVEETWEPLSLTKEHEDDYYLVKEGLVKKNKQ